MTQHLVYREVVALESGKETKMIATAISNRETLKALIDGYGKNRYHLELLRFFGSHPHARFNWLAVILSVDGNGSGAEVESALAHLSEIGVVKACVENNIHFYSLTQDESMCRQALELVKLDWYHRQQYGERDGQ